MPIKYPDKTYFKNGNKIEEYHENGKIDSYFITEKTNKKIVKSGFCNEGIVFTKETIYYNRFNQAYKKDIWISNLDEDDHFESHLIPHFSLFGDMLLIKHNYEEEEKNYPEIKLDVKVKD